MLFCKTNRPYMMLGMPNTGTDWFAKQICNANSHIKYYREFFNPITNDIYSKKIAEIFGCEIPETVENIARPCSWQEYKNILEQTWSKENINFTKENYSIWKIDHHHRIFNCFVLHRDLEFCLPAQNRAADDVNDWYMAIYTSAVNNIDFLDQKIFPLIKFAKDNADTANKKIVSAYFIGYRQTLNTALRLNIPIIKYEKLVNDSHTELKSHLNPLKIVDSGILAEKIINSRKKREKTIDSFYCNDFIQEIKKIDQAILST